MRDRHHGCKLWLDDKEDAEWKPMNDRAATFLEDPRKALRTVLDLLKRRAKFAEEFRPKPCPLPVVPGSRVEGVEFCLGPDAEAQHLLTGP